MGDDDERGRRGERAARRYLVRRGWTILAERWRGAGGELDIVAARGDVVAVCEVKARSDPAALAEPLTAAQRARIARAAAAFVAMRPELAERTIRLDLLTVRLGRRRCAVRRLPGGAGDPTGSEGRVGRRLERAAVER
jgi:putative endonuclease